MTTEQFKATHRVIDWDGETIEEVMIIEGYAVSFDVWELGGCWEPIELDAAGQPTIFDGEYTVRRLER